MSTASARTMLSPESDAVLGRLQVRGLVVGIVALAVSGLGAIFWPGAFFRTYLVGYLFCIGITHGCFALLMIYYLTGGAWGYLIRRPLEAGMRTLPFLAILFLPIAAGVREVYVWARPEEAALEGALQHRHLYLNVPFFWARAAVCFTLWLAVAHFLSRWSRQQDRTDDSAPARKLVLLSGPGLVIFGVTIMFASVDWVMSLQPAFHSSIIGPLIVSGELLTGLACVVLIAGWLALRSPLAEVVSPDVLGDLGHLLFTFLIMWAYMEFFQFMLIWIANMQVDVLWYLPRTRGGWYWVVWTIVVLHFAVPFLLLLFRSVTRSARALMRVAALLLVLHLLYLYVLVMPIFPDFGVTDVWMGVLVPVGLGGVWLALFLRNLRSGSVLPLRDPNLEVAIHLRAFDAQQAARKEASNA